MKNTMRKILLIIFCVIGLNVVTVFASDIWEGEGTEESPYLITTTDEFISIDRSDAYFKLMDDLDFGYEEITPISRFEGVLDGNSHTISNIYISIDSDYAGYTGIIEIIDNAEIFNINVNNIKIYINAEASYAGVLAGGVFNSIIRNCSVTDSSISGSDAYTGGIFGYMTNSTISKSYSKNNYIDGTGTGTLGGIAGTVSDNSILKECYYDGDIYSGSDSSSIGGICGSMRDSTIRNCYSSGKYFNYDSSSIGLLVGFFRYSTIEDSYSTATVSGNVDNIKLTGSGYEYEITNSYFDSDIVGSTEPEEQARTTEEMKQQSTYVGWDFNNIWYMEEGVSYPKLRAIDQNPSEGDNKLSILLERNEEVQLIVTDSLSDNADYDWKSSNNSIASVDYNGKVRAIKKGETVINARNTKTGFNENIYIKVVDELEKDERLAVNLKTGNSISLYLNDDNNVRYTSMDPNIANVTSNGRVTAVSKGLAIIKSEYNGKTETIYIRVY